MYSVGEQIVYGSTGVCEVADVVVGDSSRALSYLEKGKQYYLLRPLYSAGTIYAPVENPRVFMRHVISKEEANRLIDSIPSIEAEAFQAQSIQGLKEHYQSITQTHDCGDLIEMLMSIYAKQQALAEKKRKCGQVDARYMKQAEDLLYGEFAVALGIEKDAVQAYIAERIGEEAGLPQA